MTSDLTYMRPRSMSARTNPFRGNRRATPLTPEAARRQGAISTLAFRLLGGRSPALDFLNVDNPRVGGRPLAIATQSDAGFASVEREIRAQSSLPADQHVR